MILRPNRGYYPFILQLGFNLIAVGGNALHLFVLEHLDKFVVRNFLWCCAGVNSSFIMTIKAGDDRIKSPGA